VLDRVLSGFQNGIQGSGSDFFAYCFFLAFRFNVHS